MIPTYEFIIMCLFNNRLLTQDVNHGYGANQLPNETRQARSIVLGGKGGIFYKILTSRKKVTSQNYKNSNLWRGKKQVGTYMYCTYNFYFSFFSFYKKKSEGPPAHPSHPTPPPSECYVPVWCPAFFFLYRIVSFVSYTPYVDMAVPQLSRLFVLSASSICMLFIRVQTWSGQCTNYKPKRVNRSN